MKHRMKNFTRVGIALAVICAAAFISGMFTRAADVTSTDGRVHVTVPTAVSCRLMPDGSVVTPSSLSVRNNGADVIMDLHTADAYGQTVDYTVDVGGVRALTRTGGRDAAVSGGMVIPPNTTRPMTLGVSKLNRANHGALMERAANGSAALFQLGYSFKPKEPVAFAVFSEDDRSLNLYKRMEVPTVGSQFNGKRVTELYTGFETSNNFDFEGVFNKFTTVTVVDTGIAPKSMRQWFSKSLDLLSADLEKLDTSKTTDMSLLFDECWSLERVKIPFDTTNVTDMSSMFYDCRKLSTLDVSSFRTANVANMQGMFDNCLNLTSLDVSKFDTSNVTDMSNMFSFCEKLQSLNLQNFSTPKLKDTSGMFAACINLQTLNLSNMSTGQEMAYMFDNCTKLQTVTVGNKFAWNGIDSYLPTPNPSVIPGADGKWYNTSGIGFLPNEIPSNTADTYTAKVPKPKQAFAVYSATDKSFNLYKREEVPAVGSMFEGKVVTNVYTGFIEDNGGSSAPWHSASIKKNVLSIKVVDAGLMDLMQQKPLM